MRLLTNGRCEILTASGSAALAVVRLTGPGVADFLARRFSRAVASGRPIHGELRDDAGVIDDPVVVLGDDDLSADICLHGSAWIAQSVRDLAEREGFDGSSPIGPASIEEEVLAALPLVKTELAARTLLAQPIAWSRVGATDEYPHPCRDQPRGGTDEGTHPWHPDVVRAMLADRSLEYLLHPPTVAIVGLPNAGKSTLANALFGTRRSIVSPVAGTTRDWVGAQAGLDGLVVTLIDTPGLRDADDPIERQAIALSRAPVERAELTIVLLDGTRDDEPQAMIARRFPAAMLVINKGDALVPAWTAERMKALDAIAISAEREQGIEELIASVHRRFHVNARPFDAPRVWTARQRAIIAAKSSRSSTR